MGPELFYPNRGESSEEAEAVCARCPVKVECLEWAVVNNEKWGVWGGTTQRKRRWLNKLYKEHGWEKAYSMWLDGADKGS